MAVFISKSFLTPIFFFINISKSIYGRVPNYISQKITIARISIMYANYFNKIHDKSPTELGVRKC